MVSTGEITKTCWHRMTLPFTSDFLSKVSLNLALGVVTSRCCHYPSCWRIACCWLGLCLWQLMTQGNTTLEWMGVGVYNKKYNTHILGLLIRVILHRFQNLAFSSFCFRICICLTARKMIQLSQSVPFESRDGFCGQIKWRYILLINKI